MSHLRQYLEQAGVVAPERLDAALRRQQIYGGSLDTILLELEICDPQTLTELLNQACGLAVAPVELFDNGLARPWDVVPAELVEIGWAVPLARTADRVLVGVHPDLPNERLGELYRAVKTATPLVTPECCLEKIAAERTQSVVPHRYAILCASYMSAMRRRPSVSDVGFPILPALDRDEETHKGPPPKGPAAVPEAVSQELLVLGPDPARRTDIYGLDRAPNDAGPQAADSDSESESESDSDSDSDSDSQSAAIVRPPSFGRSREVADAPTLQVHDDDTAALRTPLPTAPAVSGVRVQGGVARELLPKDEIAAPATVLEGAPPVRFSARGTLLGGASELFANFDRTLAQEKMQGAQAQLRAAQTRDAAIEALVRAAMVLSPRVGLFRIRRNKLHGLSTPRSALPDLGEVVLTVETDGPLHAVIDRERWVGTTNDANLRAAVAAIDPIPCTFHRIDVAGRPLMTLYVDHGGREFLPAEADLLQQLVEVACEAFATILRSRNSGRHSTLPQAEREHAAQRSAAPPPPVAAPPAPPPQPPAVTKSKTTPPLPPAVAKPKTTPPLPPAVAKPKTTPPLPPTVARPTIPPVPPAAARPAARPTPVVPAPPATHRPPATAPVVAAPLRQTAHAKPSASDTLPPVESEEISLRPPPAFGSTEPKGWDPISDGVRQAYAATNPKHIEDLDGGPSESMRRATQVDGSPNPMALPPHAKAPLLTIPAAPPPPPLPPPPPPMDGGLHDPGVPDTLTGVPVQALRTHSGPRFIPPPLDEHENSGIISLASPIDQPTARGKITFDDEDIAPQPEPSAESVNERHAVEGVLSALARGDADVDDLRRLGTAGLRGLAGIFPGSLEVLRRDLRALPPPSAHGPHLRAAIRLGPEVTGHLTELFTREDPDVRFYAAFVFQELRDPEAMHPLSTLAFDPNSDVRVIAMRVLETYSRYEGFGSAVATVRSQLDSTNRTHQLYAARAEGTLRDTASIAKLIELLSNKDRFIQEAALESLCSVTGQQHGLKPHRWKSWFADNAQRHRIEWVIESLRHRDLPVRRWAHDELVRVTGHRVAFSPLGDRKSRGLAAEAWTDWWRQRGRERFGLSVADQTAG